VAEPELPENINHPSSARIEATSGKRRFTNQYPEHRRPAGRDRREGPGIALGVVLEPLDNFSVLSAALASRGVIRIQSMDRPDKRIHSVLFIGGSEDDLRIELDMTDHAEALKYVGALRLTDEGYEMHSWIIENANGSKEEFLLYTPEAWPTGDCLRRLPSLPRGIGLT
jgi:hypothetical protein